jgi:two-component system, OmpR family, alkaline phosphatase synthesis response regulator PhoP
MAKKILIIEDEIALVKILTLRLEANGYQVIFAIDGQKGLNLAREEKPDLIILDIMLPTMDGYQICRLLKYDGRFNQIPVIMVTAKGMDEDKKTGEQVGADAYFVKPFEPAELLEKIKELL